jgi:hypothetical protein
LNQIESEYHRIVLVFNDIIDVLLDVKSGGYHASITSIAHAQRIIEGELHNIRLNLYRYVHFIERQRTILLSRSQNIFFSTEGRLKEYDLIHQ